MKTVIAVIFAAVVIGTGITFLPAIKNITDAIFNNELVSTMDPFLKAFVGFWPIYILLGFVVGAGFIVKASRR